MEISIILGLIGTGFGAVGTGLGIFNTYNSLRKDRLRLSVTPKIAYPVGLGVSSGKLYIAIDVLNLSSFPVTVSEVGFLLANSDARMAFYRPIIIDGGAYPRRLEPRSAFSAFADFGAMNKQNFANIKCAYAKTACGKTITGKSEILESLIVEARQSQ